jgi:prepilin-type N-terminal cleavage/methylation domain-containing protein
MKEIPMFQTNTDLRASDLFRNSTFGFRISRRRGGFTLIEMLVVIGIIVVLVGLLIPAAAIAVSRSRDTVMCVEIAELEKAIQQYKDKNGDYPPSMGEVDLFDADGDGDTTESLYLAAPYTSVVETHLRTCYPKINQAEKIIFYRDLAPNMSQSEALWFWLSQTQNDERQPFFGTSGNYKKYYPFAEDRIVPTKSVPINIGGSTVPFKLNYYKPRYAKETAFVYLDSRTYIVHSVADRAAPFVPPSSSFAEAGPVQPYGDFAKMQEVSALPAPTNTAEILRRMAYQYMNPKTFQIIVAGQDGEFGPPSNQFDNNGYAIQQYDPPAGLKPFKEGTTYIGDDKDNLTNFGGGKRLVDSMP